LGRDDDMHDEQYAEAAFRVGATPRDDDFTALGDALERVRAELGLPAPAALDVLRERWPEIVGADVATHARLDAVRDGIATVTADGPMWATQLRYLEAAIVAGVEATVGVGVVTAVRVRVGA
jgi:predicted nucleic acid-binding Zn ribbon protein